LRGGGKMATVEKPRLAQNLLLAAGAVLIVMAVYSYFKSKKEGDVLPLAEEIIVQEEGVVRKSGEEFEVLTEEEVLKIKEEVDGVLESAGEKTTLVDMAETGALGEVSQAFSDGKFYFRLNAQGLISMEKGYYYEAWLKNEDVLSIGRVEVSLTGEGVLYYTASIDRSDYTAVMVTLEPEDGNPEPAKIILEAEF